jgi:hypothetical protein
MAGVTVDKEKGGFLSVVERFQGGNAAGLRAGSQTETAAMSLAGVPSHGMGGRLLRPFTTTGFLMAMLGFLALLLLESAPVLALEAIDAEVPTPSSVDEMVTPMDRSFQERLWRPGFFPWLKEELKDTPAFFRDTKLDYNFRTFYMDQNNTGVKTKEAWAIGGALSYQSGWFLDHFSLGAVGYTSQPLYAPETKDGTSLLGPNQEGYTVLGQIYGRVKLIEDNFLNLGRYQYNTPYLNANDNRMTPNTFEGYTFTGTYGGEEGAPGLRYGMGYIDKIKLRNSEEFISMSEAAGAPQVNRGVFVAGVNFTYRGFELGAIDYHSQDIINIAYAETRYRLNVTDHLGLLFSAQLTNQQSTGSELLTGSDFHTSQFGLMTSASYRNAILTLAYTNNSTGANMRNPWSSYPGYTSVQVEDFNRAGEQAFMVKGSYNFARFGLNDVSVYALWTHGWDAVDPVTKSPVFQQNEYDLDIQWRPKKGFLEGLWYRARFGHADSRDGSTSGFPINDIRFIVNYDFELL